MSINYTPGAISEFFNHSVPNEEVKKSSKRKRSSKENELHEDPLQNTIIQLDTTNDNSNGEVKKAKKLKTKSPKPSKSKENGLDESTLKNTENQPETTSTNENSEVAAKKNKKLKKKNAILSKEPSLNEKSEELYNKGTLNTVKDTKKNKRKAKKIKYLLKKQLTLLENKQSNGISKTPEQGNKKPAGKDIQDTTFNIEIVKEKKKSAQKKLKKQRQAQRKKNSSEGSQQAKGLDENCKPTEKQYAKKLKKEKAQMKKDACKFNKVVQKEVEETIENISPEDEKPKTDPEKRTLFVGNLPLNINVDQLKALFKPFGKVETARLRSAIPARPGLPKKVAVIKKEFHPESPSLNGYVVMSEIEDALKSLSLNSTLVQQNHIVVSMANEMQNFNKHSIFVGNVPFNVTDEELRSSFKDCGEIERVRIIRDPATRVTKGFGYVMFLKSKGKKTALKKTNIHLRGRRLRVSSTNPFDDKKPKFGDNSLQQANENKPLLKRLKLEKPRSFEGLRSEDNKKERAKFQKKLNVLKKADSVKY